MTEFTMKKARDEFAYEIPGLSGELEHIRKQWNTLKYLDHLGEQTKTKIDGWNLNMFRGDAGSIITDRRKINEIFFKFRESLPPAAIQAENIIDAATAARVDGLLKGMAKYAQQTVNTDVRDLSRTVRVQATKLQDTKAELFKKSMTLKALREMELSKAGVGKAYDSIKQLLSEGFYTLDVNQPSTGMAFITEPISLSHFNARHGITHVVPMGTYRVLLTMTRFGYLQAKVRPWDKNPVRSEYYHPHVSQGEVCWGNMANTYHQASAECDFLTMGRVLMDVLKTYNSGNPFLELYAFFEAYKADEVTTLGRFPGEDLPPVVSDEDGLDQDQFDAEAEEASEEEEDDENPD